MKVKKNSTHSVEELKEHWSDSVSSDDINLLKKCFENNETETNNDTIEFQTTTSDDSYEFKISVSDDCECDNKSYDMNVTENDEVSVTGHIDDFDDEYCIECSDDEGEGEIFDEPDFLDDLEDEDSDEESDDDLDSFEFGGYTSFNELDTDEQFVYAINECRDIFAKKLCDYTASWRIMRPTSITDQIYIKANRIRSIEESGVSLVGEGILPEFMAIVNYGIVGLIQLKLKYANGVDLSNDKALSYYDEFAQIAYDLMTKKNHDYNEAWRLMRTCSYTDFILTKIYRTKQIEENHGNTLISEGIDANYLDMINYAVFGIIKLKEEALRVK